MSAPQYTPEQVTKALLQLVVNQGDVGKTADELIDDAFMVPATTLRRWKTVDHAEQYRQLLNSFNLEIEQETLARARDIAYDASDLERELLKKVREKLPQMDGKEAANAARAIADVKAKAIDKMVALSGRAGDDHDSEDLTELAERMAAKGFIRLPGQPNGDDAS